ncbi:putative zinc-binding protein [Pseudodesulfovibrio sp.]|uniref:putative zinc-binding protein n=1 Tax=unclassified Pseudodesulfovibrio TaxID=2661612 RepID=UPI003AFF6F1A
MSECSCSCGAAPKFVFSCSGAADVGEVADQAARTLNRKGALKMFCLAGIGGGISGIVESTKAAEKIVAVDGCPLHCALKTLEKAGFTEVEHVRLADLGFAKGESPATEENIQKVVAAVEKQIG